MENYSRTQTNNKAILCKLLQQLQLIHVTFNHYAFYDNIAIKEIIKQINYLQTITRKAQKLTI